MKVNLNGIVVELNRHERLSPFEMELIRRFYDKRTTREISNFLQVSDRAVEDYLESTIWFPQV